MYLPANLTFRITGTPGLLRIRIQTTSVTWAGNFRRKTHTSHRGCFHLYNPFPSGVLRFLPRPKFCSFAFFWGALLFSRIGWMCIVQTENPWQSERPVPLVYHFFHLYLGTYLPGIITSIVCYDPRC